MSKPRGRLSEKAESGKPDSWLTRTRAVSGKICVGFIAPRSLRYCTTYRPPNVFTLSCKNRLTCLPREAARRLPRLTRNGKSELQPPCRARAVRAAGGGAPPGQRTGGFCQLVRAVSRRAHATHVRVLRWRMP